MKFFELILGEVGAKALNNTAEILKPVVVPRAIVSWVSMMGDVGFDGEVPGVPGSYISLKKNETGYWGAIKVEDELITFDKAAIPHVAATLGIALGIELPEISEQLKTRDMEALGKSIDLLVKSEFLRKRGDFGPTPPKPPKQEPLDKPKSHVNENNSFGGHLSQKKQVPPEMAKQNPPGAKDTVYHPPIAAGQGQEEQAKALKNAHSPKAQKSFDLSDEVSESSGSEDSESSESSSTEELQKIKITKDEMKRPCLKCGSVRFEKSEFKSCSCFPALAKSVSFQSSPDGVLLVLNKRVSMDTLEALVTLFKE
jgi:hypothetical protein